MFYEAKGIKNPYFGPNKGTIGYQELEVIGVWKMETCYVIALTVFPVLE